MGEKLRIAGMSLGGLIGLLALVFCLGLFGLGYYKFFGPKTENVRREIFENTQSYVQGKIQDLAKYKDEYDHGDDKSRESIRQLILARFAEFDETKIQVEGLKSFLVRMRGY